MQLNFASHYIEQGASERALELSHKHGLTQAKGFSLDAMAYIATKQADYQGALAFYQEVLQVFGKGHDNPNNTLLK